MNIGPALSSLTPGMLSRASLPLDSGAVEGFAKEITRRSSQTPTQEGAARTVDDKGLETAITGAVNYVKDTYGDQAANTVMGIVLNRAGSGPLTEDDVGDGFVNALEFIDRTFGTTAGDQAIGVFNNQLNQAINGYFQNGKNESFLVKDQQTAMDDLNAAKGSAVASVAETFQQNAAGSQPSLMDLAGGGLNDFTQSGNSDPKLPVDENGKPLTGDGTPMTASGETGSTATDAATGAKANNGRAVAGKHRRRGLARGRTGVAGGYEQSGLTPGLVLNKSA